MPINAEAVCVPPTLGISRCQGDINKAGCALSSALKLSFFLLTVYSVMHFLGRGDAHGIVAIVAWRLLQLVVTHIFQNITERVVYLKSARNFNYPVCWVDFTTQ